jgi:hypothetical protein
MLFGGLPWVRRKRREAEREQQLLALITELERLVPVVEAGADVMAAAYVKAGLAVPAVFQRGSGHGGSVVYLRPGGRPDGRARHRRQRRTLQPAR